MSAKVEDKSLDEIIKADRQKKIKKSGSGSRDHRGNKNESKDRRKGDRDGNRDKDRDRDHKPRNFNGRPREGFNRNRADAQAKENSAAILVLNMPAQVKVDEVNTLFAQFGNIEKINLYWIPERRRSCNAKIFFTEKASAEKALNELNNAELDNHQLKIKFD